MYLITDHCQWADKSDRDQESIDDVSAGWKSGKKYHYILHVSANYFFLHAVARSFINISCSDEPLLNLFVQG